MRLLSVVLAILFLAGCATVDMPPASPGPLVSALEQDYFHVKIPTHDGLELEATVYQPELAPGETAPVIITTHGFGGFRAKRPFSIYGKTMITGEAALAAWRKGYWVVFYDQRGWGDSDGVVHGMDPEFEVKDVSTVIDWTLAHVPAIKRLDDGSPALGMIGESYGGGAQLLATFRDPRLKAMVPIASWYDLRDIAPHNHMKTNWGAALFVLGGISSGFDVGFMMKKPHRSGFGGTLNDEALDILYERSPLAHCERGEAPQGDVLLVNGFRDNLFGVQQAVANQACFQAHGRDARLLAIQGGHILPWPMQKWSGKPYFNTDENISCSGYENTLVDTIVAWWDEKLLNAEAEVPETCITLDYESGLDDPQRFFIEGTQFSVPNSKLHIPFAGMFEWLMIPSDVVGDVFRKGWPGADTRHLNPNGGFGRPKFIPVYLAHEDEVLSGIPEINLRLDGSASKFSTRVFVGVGVQKAGQRRVHVVSEQLHPLPKKGFYRESLPAISTPLERGDRVGLVVYGYTWQYFTNPSYWWSQARIRGDLTLPIREPLE